jgi:TPR repeat protein
MIIRKIGLALALGLSLAGSASAGAIYENFDRVLPADFRAMLLKAKHAYEAKRYDEAFATFQRSACAGDKESQSALGRMYLLGQGVARDDLTGYAWLKVAAEMRMRGYQTIVDKIEHSMTAEQKRIAEPEAAKLIENYGLRASKMSCNLTASQGGHIMDGVTCAPQEDGPNLLLKRCVDALPSVGH